MVKSYLFRTTSPFVSPQSSSLWGIRELSRSVNHFHSGGQARPLLYRACFSLFWCTFDRRGFPWTPSVEHVLHFSSLDRSVLTFLFRKDPPAVSEFLQILDVVCLAVQEVYTTLNRVCKRFVPQLPFSSSPSALMSPTLACVEGGPERNLLQKIHYAVERKREEERTHWRPLMNTFCYIYLPHFPMRDAGRSSRTFEHAVSVCYLVNATSSL